MEGLDIIEWAPSAVFRFVDVAGVVANSLLGGILARSMRFDIIGFVVVGIISGLGGGMLRDVLLQQGFPVALTDPLYLSGALTGAAIAYLIPVKRTWTKRVLDWFEVLALGAWGATGAQKALGAGLGLLPAILLGVLTAVGGGMTRDVLVGRTPRIFGGNQLDATLAAVGALIAAIAYRLGYADAGMGVSILLVFLFGQLVRHKEWVLPHAPEWETLSRLGLRAAVRQSLNLRKDNGERLADKETGPVEGPSQTPGVQGSTAAPDWPANENEAAQDEEAPHEEGDTPRA